MEDKNKTKEQLINELREIRRRNAELEAAKIEHRRVEAKREHLLEAERQQRVQTEALRWAGAVLSSTLDYEKVLDHILEQVGRVIAHRAACVMLVEGKTARLFRWRGYTWFETEDSPAVTPFNISDIPNLRTVRETGWPLATPYVSDYNEWVTRSGQPWIKSSISVPIRTQSRFIGFLHVDSDISGFYSQADAERLQAFAQQAAIALENARRFNRTRQEIIRRVKELKQERNFVSAILDTAGALVVVLDAEWSIARFNQTCERTTGYTFEEVECKQVWDLFLPPEEVGAVKAVFDQLQEGQFPNRHENEWVTREGQRRRIAWSNTVLLDREGSLEYVISTGIDITERKQVEAEREKLIAELDAFAHTVAHDLKQPLSKIIGYIDSLKKYYASMSEAELQEHLQTIVRNGLKLSNIIDELLLLASVRQQDVVATPLDMAGIVAEAQQRLSYMIEEYQAEIILPAEWPVALGYEPWVEEVWANYLSNAVKYGGRPPRLELGANRQPDGMIRFWMRDNGPGLTPEEQAQLFTSFTQLNQVRAEGHGLGLSIVRRIVKKLGGQVGVESEGVPGQGSIFSFTLPDQCLSDKTK